MGEMGRGVQLQVGGHPLFSSSFHEVLAVLGHDLRTPLHKMTGFLELLAGTNLDTRQKRLLALSDAEGADLLEMLNGILAAVQAETGYWILNDEWHDLRETLSAVEKSFRAQAELRDIGFECHVHPALSQWWFFDRVKLRQVLANLLGNSLKYTSVGSILLAAERASTCGEETLQLRVLDTGCGIPAARRKELFEPFGRGESAKVRLPGYGLGLAIVRRLVVEMGGTVSIHSVENLGTEVSLRFPFREREEAPNPR